MKYDLILADVPHEYQNWTSKKNGAAIAHYDTLSVQDLCDLPIGDLAADNSILLFWATFPKLIESLKILEAWGFKYISTMFVWNKTYQSGKPYMGLGFTTRSGCEIVLYGKRGKGLKRQSSSVKQVITAPVLRPHSSKPIEIYDRIDELLGTDIKKLELFAREQAPGWDAIGYEIDGKDIKEALQDILNPNPDPSTVMTKIED